MTARWPAMMRRKTAAEYLDMTEAAFVREVMAGRLPSGTTLGGREDRPWLKAEHPLAYKRMLMSREQWAALAHWLPMIADAIESGADRKDG